MTVILPPQSFEADLLGKFGHVSAWVFDLDNTLYPADCGLWPAIEQRIALFLMGLTGLDGLSARAMQRYYYRRHGTTLRGLVEENVVRAPTSSSNSSTTSTAPRSRPIRRWRARSSDCLGAS